MSINVLQTFLNIDKFEMTQNILLTLILTLFNQYLTKNKKTGHCKDHSFNLVQNLNQMYIISNIYCTTAIELLRCI